MSEFPSLAEVLATHSPENCWWKCDGGTAMDRQAHTRHQADAWREACTIRTVEELHAAHLTDWGTLIKEIHTPNDGCEDHLCWVMPKLWLMVNQMGWMPVDEWAIDSEPKLPALLIWSPDWERP